jgi:hypothetical protein
MAIRLLKRAAATLSVVCVMFVVSASALFAQIEVPGGPGQVAPQPQALCPGTVSCTFAERNFLPDGYRVQRLDVCGANCTSQYWISNRSDGAMLLEVDPVRGGGIVAVGRASSSVPHPAVRTILPDPQPGEPACCHSQYSDTTYAWDNATGTLVVDTQATIPAADFGGWESVSSALQAEQFIVVFP